MKLKDIIEEYGANNLSVALNVSRPTVYSWQFYRAIPKPATFLLLMKLDKRVNYHDVLIDFAKNNKQLKKSLPLI